MTEKNEIVLMNFTGVYKEQEFYREEKISWVDVQGLSGCSCYCDGEAREILGKENCGSSGKRHSFCGFGELSLYEPALAEKSPQAFSSAGI